MHPLDVDNDPYHLHETAIYFFLRQEGARLRVVYVGQANDLAQRVCPKNHPMKRDGHKYDQIAHMLFWKPMEKWRLNCAEQCFIRLFWPEHNKRKPRSGRDEHFWALVLVKAMDAEDRPALREFLTACPFPIPPERKSMSAALMSALNMPPWYLDRN